MSNRYSMHCIFILFYHYQLHFLGRGRKGRPINSSPLHHAPPVAEDNSVGSAPNPVPQTEIINGHQSAKAFCGEDTLSWAS